MRLFGRDELSSSLEEFLADREGGPRLMLLRGDPGSGKSALLEATAHMAPPGLVLTMVGLEALAHVEMAAAMGALNQLTSEAGGDTLLARLLDDDSASRIMPVQVFEATRRRLEGQRVWLVIDDVQWLDHITLGLILYLLKNAEEPSRVLAASRPGHAASFFLEEVGKTGVDPLVLEIGPLAEADGVELAMSLKPALTHEEARSIWQRAGGLPYWLIALARDRDQASSDELLTSRLRAATPDAVSLLVHLAVLGRPIAIHDLEGLLDWSSARVEESMLDLESRALLRRRFDQLGMVHDLIREETIAQAGVETRAGAHSRISSYLETTAEGRTEALLEALHHRLEAGASARSLALALLMSPRRHLLGEGSLTHLARAADQAGPEDDEEALLHRSVAQLATDIGSNDMASLRWLTVFERTKDPVERTWAACQMSRIAHQSEDFRDSRKWLEVARCITEPDELNRIEMATLEAELLMLGEQRQQEGRAMAEEAMSQAEELRLMPGDAPDEDRLGRAAVVRVDVLQAAYDSAMISADQHKSLEVALMMVGAARSKLERLVAVGLQGRALMRVGRPIEARSILESLWLRAQDMGLVSLIARFGHAYAQSLYETGRLAQATKVAEEVIPVAERQGFPRGAYYARQTTALSTLITEDWRIGLETMRIAVQGEDDPHYRLTLRQMVATYLSRTMRDKSASDIATILQAGWVDAGLAKCHRCASEFAAAAAEASARAGMAEEAERWLGRFREVKVPLNRLAEAYIQLAEALLAADPGPLQIVRARFAAMGFEIEQLWIGLDLAAARAAQPGRPQAADTYREVAPEAELLGAETIQLLAEKALRGLGARTWRRTGSGEMLGLTERELEIAQMAVSGSSNREIAQSLFLSKKTVERHLSNILAKVGVRNRVELAGLLSKTAAINEGMPR